jgi:hypothetical protein
MTPTELTAYLERVRCAARPSCSVEWLRELVAAHVSAIPFENLNPFLDLPVDLEDDAVFRKLYATRNGIEVSSAATLVRRRGEIHQLPSPMTASDKPRYLFLLRQPYDGTEARPAPEQMQQIMSEFMNWLDDIRAKHEVLSTHGLDHRCQIVRGARGELLSDGPYLESKEIVGGYVLLTADSFAEALDIARGCPGLRWGMGVEVRPVIAT